MKQYKNYEYEYDTDLKGYAIYLNGEFTCMVCKTIREVKKAIDNQNEEE